MAEDEIERLLREIDATSAKPAAQPPTKKASAEVVTPAESTSGGRLAFAGIAAVGLGIGAFLFGIFTPWTDALDMGVAAAGAAFVTALVAGPPRWFSS